MLFLVYTSTATGTFNDADLATLLMNSRANNRRLGLTGVLLFKEKKFLQVLEGPDNTVRERLEIITGDPRHTDLAILVEDEKADRQFPAWSMGYEPVSDTLAGQIPGYRATFDDVISSTDFRSRPALGEMLSWFQQRTQHAA